MEEFNRVKRRKNLFLFGFVLFVALCAFVYFFSRSSRRVREIASGSGTASRFWSAGADAGYVDPSLCRACHSDIYKTYKLTGMGRSFSRPTAENTAQNSRTKVFYHPGSDRYYTMSERDGKYYQRRYQTGLNGAETNVVEKEIHFVVGSGNHARTYLHRDEQGRIFEMPLAWYAENGGAWGMNPGYDRPDHQDFRRRITYACLFCHNAYPEIEEGSDASGTEPVVKGRIPEGIDCQRCHGPGRDHILAVQAEGATAETRRLSIVNPRRLGPDRQLEVCMQCHLESTSFRLPYFIQRYERGAFSYRPGEVLAGFGLHFDHAAGTAHDDKFEIAHQAYRMRKSACFEKSGGAFTCVTCHNPHDVLRGERAARHYISVCRRCHGSTLEKLAASGRHTRAQDCLPCHMPKRRTEDVVHVVMTDHYIQRRKPARDLLAPLRERHDTEETRYRGEVALYYPPHLPPAAENDLYLAVAQVKHNTNLIKGIPRLEKLLELHRPEAAEFYFELGEAYGETGQIAKAAGMYEQVLRRKARFLPALHKLGVALARSGEPGRAVELFRRSLQLAPREATILNDLALAYRQQGRLDDAIAALRDAISSDPDHAQAHNNLGGLLLEKGERSGAEASFRNAVRIQPDFAAARSNLGRVLAARGDFAEARHHFEIPIVSQPKFVSARYDYALASLKEGDGGRAQRLLEQALELEPNLAEAHSSLGDALAMQGKIGAAIARYREAIRLNPDYYQAHLSLGNALAASRNAAEALTHYRKAAESPDREIRDAGIEMLKKMSPSR